MGKIRRFFALYWQTMAAAIVVLAVVVGLLGFQLGTIVPGMSAAEVAFVDSASSIEKIIENPLNIMMKLPLLALQHFGYATPLSVRAVGATFGVLTVLLFYAAMRQWHTQRTALLTSFLLIVSSWFLQISRLALPYILLAFGVILLITIARILHNKQASKRGVWCAALAAVSLVYTPSLVWFLILIGIWQFPAITRQLRSLGADSKVLLTIALLGLLAPFVYASYRDISVLQQAFAIPSSFIPYEWLQRLLVLPVFVTAQGPLDPTYNLGRLPLLDVFTTTLMVLGVYAYYFKLKLQRTQLFIVMTILASVIIALNGPVFLPLLMPIVFIVAGSGLTLLLQQWFTVFPRNPIARSVGVLTIALVIGITGVYHTRRYFVAWAGNPETRNEFIYLLERE